MICSRKHSLNRFYLEKSDPVERKIIEFEFKIENRNYTKNRKKAKVKKANRKEKNQSKRCL